MASHGTVSTSRITQSRTVLAVSSRAEAMARHFSGGPSPGHFRAGKGDHRPRRALACNTGLRQPDCQQSLLGS